jgi:4-amino-4-deoxy-L-arabinose transferase-like glycosyltransferase
VEQEGFPQVNTEEAVPTTSPQVPPGAETGAGASWLRLLTEPLLIGMLALTVYLAGNGRVGLWDRDEPRYAVCVREMRARHDWIFPTYNAEPRYHKPILIYWLMRLGVAIGGDNPFGMRLVSGFAGAGTCLLVWGLGRRMFGPSVGRLGALILATAPIMLVESKLATTDATLAFWFVAGQFCLWELGRRPSRRLAALFWVLVGLGILTKGPVSVALLAASGLASWWWGGPTACWKRLHWRPGLAIVAAVTLPWLIAIGIVSKGDFYRVAVGFHIIQRVTTGIEEHGGFPGYYAVLSLATFYPWSAFLPAAWLGGWRRRRSDPALGFLLGWIVGPLVFLELVRTKLIHYYLPAYPACALLVAWLVVTLVREEVTIRRWPLGRLAMGLLTGIGLGTVVALVAVACVVSGPVRWPCASLAILLTAGTLAAVLRLSRGATDRAMVPLVATWGLMGLGIGAWLLPSLEPYRMSRRVGERLAAISDELKVEPVLLTFQEPSTIYAFGRPVMTVRVWADLYDQIRKHGEVVTPVLAHELRGLRRHPQLEVEAGEGMKCFNLSKGKIQSLTVTRIRPRGDWTKSPPSLTPFSDDPSVRIAGGPEESQIK